jgi:hypothetical protein
VIISAHHTAMLHQPAADHIHHTVITTPAEAGPKGRRDCSPTHHGQHT